MGNGFKVTKDIYKRGNGRWAKVVRLHHKIGEPVNGQQQWKAYYYVACGYADQIQAHDGRSYPQKQMALSVAQDWIDYEG